ncbi:MAG: helix-turn-helix domain-containing protein [Stenomitos rutilans HA7619-LM2]|jgi:transcriptional regulator with XRE-family HTH domain|nr:helix-turn-helix domain-containing protein [Stenomitos rutilans HA7619-LM2]
MRSQEPNEQDRKELQKELGQRIAQVAEGLGGKRALAEKIGLSEGQIYRYINAQSDPTSKVLVRIADAAEVSLDWLLKGKTAPLNSDHSTNGSSKVNNTVRLKGSAVISFEAEWLLSQKFGGDPANLEVIQIESDQGMKPTLGIGDLIIVDLSKREIGSGIYYIRLEDSRDMVRRLQYIDRHTAKLISDDRAYEPILHPIEKLEILGQVVWIGKEYS